MTKNIIVFCLIIVLVFLWSANNGCPQNLEAWNTKNWVKFESDELNVRFIHPANYEVFIISKNEIIVMENKQNFLVIQLFNDTMINALEKVKSEYHLNGGKPPVEWEKSQLLAEDGIYWLRVNFPVNKDSSIRRFIVFVASMPAKELGKNIKFLEPRNITRADIFADWPAGWNNHTEHCEEPITVPQEIANTITVVRL